jgi:hypothetical protein
MRAAIIFVVIETAAFVLSCLHALPISGIACIVLGGCVVGLVIENVDNPGKPLQNIEEPMPPVGLGGYVLDTSGKTRERATSYLWSETRKTIVLMKDIDAELEERNDKAFCVRSRYGHTFTIGEESIDYPALMARSTISVDWAGKSDNGYDLPRASYPMEMET